MYIEVKSISVDESERYRVSAYPCAGVYVVDDEVLVVVTDVVMLLASTAKDFVKPGHPEGVFGYTSTEEVYQPIPSENSVVMNTNALLKLLAVAQDPSLAKELCQ